MKTNPVLESLRTKLMAALNDLPKGYTTIVQVSEPQHLDDGEEQSLQFISGDINDFHANIFELLQAVHGDDFDPASAERLAHILSNLAIRFSKRSDTVVN